MSQAEDKSIPKPDRRLQGTEQRMSGGGVWEETTTYTERTHTDPDTGETCTERTETDPDTGASYTERTHTDPGTGEIRTERTETDPDIDV